MNTLEKHRGWTLLVSLFAGAVASIVGICIGYQTGFSTNHDPLLDELLADIYYAKNPVECPPCDKGIKYEWFYVEPPTDIHLPEGEEVPTAKKEGGNAMDP